MLGVTGTALLGLTMLSFIQVAAAQESAGLIITGTVAGVVLLLICIGVTLFCFYNRRGQKEKNKNQRRKQKPKIFVANGVPPPLPPQPYMKQHPANGFVRQLSAPRMPPPEMVASVPIPPPAPQVYMDPVPPPAPITVPYATYHGPPPEMRYQVQGPSRPETMSGPPPIVIPFETTAGSGGTVTVRPDPRPVVHKRSKYKKRERIDIRDDRRRSPSKHRSPSRPKSQEFVVQQSYDGIPVIRPVIYIDDDDDRPRHRSKSRDRRHKNSSQSPKGGAQITEITDETKTKHIQAEVEINTDQSQSRLLTPPSTKKDRSRTSSVTEAVNALRMSVKDHLDDDSDSNASHSSKAPSFGWAQSEQRAPDPVAGDVIFFPKGAEVETSRNTEPHIKEKEQVYGYTKVIRTSTKERAPTPESPVPVPGTSSILNEGYEVPKDLRRSIVSTHDEGKTYQTEHDPVPAPYTDIGASMSDRLQHLVEDGDKTRFSHYNVGAINFTEEDGEQDEPVQMRVKRPETPPVDIPRDSFYSKVIKRPKTPENDIPLISPRESTEVPPLNLRSTVTSPREQSYSYRPETPPKDFPITPQSSFTRPRPPTPPTDFPVTPKDSIVSPRPPTPPYDVLDTSRLGETQRSTAVDPTTGEPGSFQARQRLIEAHLQKNAQTGPSTGPSPKPVPSSVPKPSSTPAPPPPVPVVTVTPGVIPPAPPPPPIPK